VTVVWAAAEALSAADARTVITPRPIDERSCRMSPPDGPDRYTATVSAGADAVMKPDLRVSVSVFERTVNAAL